MIATHPADRNGRSLFGLDSGWAAVYGIPGMNERFVGEAIVPEDASFATGAMAMGMPGLPTAFSWKGERFSVGEVLEAWKECGDCRHGSGERYVRKHWFRIRTTEGREMKIYFERQGRSSGGSRWRLFSVA